MTIRILAFGNSLTEGWCEFGTRFHPYALKLQNLMESECKTESIDIVNKGVSGETTDEMNARLPEVLDEGGPFDIVIILGGTNDLGMRLDEDGEPLFSRLRSLHELALLTVSHTILIMLGQRI